MSIRISLGIRGVLGVVVGLFAVGLGVLRRDAAAMGFGLAVLAFFAAIGAVIAAMDRRRLADDETGDPEDSESGRPS